MAKSAKSSLGASAASSESEEEDGDGPIDEITDLHGHVAIAM